MTHSFKTTFPFRKFIDQLWLWIIDYLFTHTFRMLETLIKTIFSFQFSIQDEIEICQEVWKGFLRIFFGTTTILLQFCLPFAFSLYVYLHIINALKDRTKAKLRYSVHLQRRKNIKATHRLVYLLLLQVLFKKLHFTNPWVYSIFWRILDLSDNFFLKSEQKIIFFYNK